MTTTDHHLLSADLRKLRPTQITVGFAEVREKRRRWQTLPKRHRADYLRSHVLPVVLGPQAELFVIDHHHLGVALIDEGVAATHAMVLRDLSHLEPDEFWLLMEHHQWVHPYDETGVRRTVADLPRKLSQLRDDPYRSLAGDVCHAGGYAKSAMPFAEFLWADFFRRRVPGSLLSEDPLRALKRAIKLARSGAARHLPGCLGAPDA